MAWKQQHFRPEGIIISVLSLISGLVDLNGRFFGGRVVKACFYNLDKFRRMDYDSPIE